MTSIRRYCAAIAREFHPQRIVLFGSHASGRPHRDSDVDVLVIMKASRRLGRRPSLAIRQRVPANFPVDVIVRDPQDFAWRIAQGDSFLREIVETGRVMYECANSLQLTAGRRSLPAS